MYQWTDTQPMAAPRGVGVLRRVVETVRPAPSGVECRLCLQRFDTAPANCTACGGTDFVER